MSSPEAERILNEMIADWLRYLDKGHVSYSNVCYQRAHHWYRFILTSRDRTNGNRW